MKKLLFLLTFALFAASCTSQAVKDADDTTDPAQESIDSTKDSDNADAAEPADANENTDKPATSADIGSGEVIKVEAGTFESPSGNILCSMKEDYVDCYILEKNWEIKESDVPKDCDFDSGNGLAIGLGETVPGFECYSDAYYLGYEGTTLEYGTSMTTGEFTCSSSKEGVRCEDSDSQGFTMAKDTYPLG